MDNKNVCPKCGQIYEAGLNKCPLCGAAAPIAPAPEQPEPARENGKGGKFLSREAKKELKNEEETFLREEEARYRRMKRRGESDAPEEEPDPRIPTGFLVSSVIILLAALLIGGSFLLWKTGAAKIGVYDRLAKKTGESVSPVLPIFTQAKSPEESTAASDSTQQTEPVTEPTVPSDLPAYDPNLVILVNEANPIPADYAVGETSLLRMGAVVSDRCFDDLSAMFQACRAEMHYPDAYFGYDEFAPDTSEYRTGLAIDIFTDNGPSTDVAEMSESETLIWLAEHCYEYGFILRNPEGKEDLTGHSYEPWHFRYVGKDVAAYMHDNDLCLEEFAALLG